MSLEALPPVMGHRGAAAHAPENTLASLARAAEEGASWVEFDVMLTGDDVPVLFHDDKLARTTGQDGLTAETDFEVLHGFDAGSWFGPDFAGEPVPSLAEAVACLTGLGLRANIEFKPSEGRAVETAEAAMVTLSRTWPRDAEPPLISSFKPECLAIARRVQPDWPRAFIALELAPDWAEAARALDCTSYHLYHKVLTKAVARDIKEAGFLLASFTVNEGALARRLRGWGVDCVISDYPGKMLKALAS